MLVVAVSCPPVPAEAATTGLWLADRVAAWHAAARVGLDPARQRHFLATLGPDLVRTFQAEEDDLAQAGAWALRSQQAAHRALAQRLSVLLQGMVEGRDLSLGIRDLLEAWLRHHSLAVPGVRQPVAGTGH